MATAVRMSTAAARRAFAETIGKVKKGERIIFQEDGKDAVAIVPLEDLDDMLLLEDARASKKKSKGKRTPYRQVRKELGLA